TADAARQLRDRSARLTPVLLTRDIDRKRDELGQLSSRLCRAGQVQTQGWRRQLDALERMRQTLGYTETLKRGYAVVRSGEAVITTKAAAETATALEIEFQDGRFALGGRPSRKSGGKDDPPQQGSLF
ncbi:MAG: exodeoxyribonuclease VII large subunit, partial [Paracoccaceae bacterium]